jgi:hypothetical protein
MREELSKATPVANLFIIGESKTGTTSLFHWLSQHSQIGGSEVKEPQFFSTDLHRETILNGGDLPEYSRSLDTYHNLWTESNEYQIEASTDYAHSREAPRNLAAYNSNAKIIMGFRHPYQFLCSLHSQCVDTYRENPDFLSSLSKDRDRRRGFAVPKGVSASKLNYLHRIQFATHLRHWQSAFNDNIFVYFLSDLDNPDSLMEDIYRFLELPSEPFEETKHNTRKEIRWPKLHHFLKHSDISNAIGNVLPNTIRRGWGFLFRTIFVRESTQSFNDWEKLPRRYQRAAKEQKRKLGRMLDRDIPDDWPQ